MYFGPGSLSKKMRELSGMKNWSPVPATTIVGMVYLSMKPSRERHTTSKYIISSDVSQGFYSLTYKLGTQLYKSVLH